MRFWGFWKQKNVNNFCLDDDSTTRIWSHDTSQWKAMFDHSAIFTKLMCQSVILSTTNFSPSYSNGLIFLPISQFLKQDKVMFGISANQILISMVAWVSHHWLTCSTGAREMASLLNVSFFHETDHSKLTFLPYFVRWTFFIWLPKSFTSLWQVRK